MALKNCKECKKEVSDKAKVCPHCGVSKPVPALNEVATAFIIVAVLVASFTFIMSSEEEVPAPVLSREQQIKKERKELISQGFSAWDGSHIALTRVLKDAMNDPSSYEHIETSYWDKGDTLRVVTEFRGRNGFGGMVKNRVIAKVDVASGEVIEIESQE